MTSARIDHNYIIRSINAKLINLNLAGAGDSDINKEIKMEILDASVGPGLSGLISEHICIEVEARTDFGVQLAVTPKTEIGKLIAQRVVTFVNFQFKTEQWVQKKKSNRGANFGNAMADLKEESANGKPPENRKAKDEELERRKRIAEKLENTNDFSFLRFVFQNGLLACLLVLVCGAAYWVGNPLLNARDLLGIANQFDLAKGIDDVGKMKTSNEFKMLNQIDSFKRIKRMTMDPSSSKVGFESFVMRVEKDEKVKGVQSVQGSLELTDLLGEGGEGIQGSRETLLSQFPIFDFSQIIRTPAINLSRNGWKYDGANGLTKSDEKFSILLGLDIKREYVASIYYEISDPRKYQLEDLGVLLNVHFGTVRPSDYEYRGDYICGKRWHVGSNHAGRTLGAVVCISDKSPRKWISITPTGK